MQKLIFFSVLLTTTIFVVGEKLLIKSLNTKLPIFLQETALFYDQEDSIYLFGGRINGSVPSSSIYHFNISSEEIGLFGDLGSHGYANSVQMCPSDIPDSFTVCYFGAYDDKLEEHKTVLQYNLDHELTTPITSSLPYSAVHSTSVPYNSTDALNSSYAYIFGGDGSVDGIIRYNMITKSAVTLNGKIPSRIPHKTSVRVGDYAFILGGPTPYRFDLEEEVFSSGNATFPEAMEYTTSVYDGKHVYVIGTFRENVSHAPAPYSGIIRFHPETFEDELMEVEGFPLDENTIFRSAPNSVFVEKMNGIYFFGGTTFKDGEEIYHDDIWFLELPVEMETSEPTDSTSPAMTQETTTTSTTTTTEEITYSTASTATTSTSFTKPPIPTSTSTEAEEQSTTETTSTTLKSSSAGLMYSSLGISTVMGLKCLLQHFWTSSVFN